MAFSAPVDPAQSSALRLWYDRPAGEWVEALPLGNGRLGAMVHGRADEEVISLNDNTLYAGGPRSRELPLDIAKDVDRVVGLLRNGQHADADAFIDRHWLGRGQNSYQPLGRLLLDFADRSPASDYSRELDLNTATATTTYTRNGVTFTTEQFASHVDGVLALRLRAGGAAALDFTIRLDSPHPTARFTATDDAALTMAGRVPYLVVRRELAWLEKYDQQWKYPELFEPGGRRKPLPDDGHLSDKTIPVLYDDAPDGRGTPFAAGVRVRATGGSVRAEGDALRVRGATEAVLLLAVGSGFAGFDKPPTADAAAEARIALDRVADTTFTTLRDRHVADYQKLFDRVTIDLGPVTEKGRLPTDRRIAAYKDGGDESLAALYFQFARYLMIAGSRPGSQPLNLQGLWNDLVVPPWASGYTTNINAEMNYWPAEVANLSECHEPLLRMIEDLAVTGRRTATESLKRPGWVCFHNTDIWRDAQPVDNIARTSWWPMAGGWLSQHLWQRYAYTGDAAFLRDRAYPLMKGAAEFYLAWLVDDGQGRLVTPAGTSPENGFKYTEADGRPRTASVVMGPTMDIAIIRELFANCIAASETLALDAEFRAELRTAHAKLLPYQIGGRGQLLEWPSEFDETEPKHRHVSHLYGLHPGDGITRRGTPELFDAARRTLELRGDDGTGWSLAWKINFRARTEEGDHARRLIGMMLTPARTYPNLFDAHPPFQIDGNFGAAAGIAEMLLQSHGGEVRLLPALPKAWPDGSVRGLRARGGIEVDVAWRDGRLEHATLRPARDGACVVRYGEQTTRFDARAGRTYRVESDLVVMEQTAH